MTTLSVTVALVIGTVELLQVLAARFGLTGGFWAALNSLDLESLGYVVVLLFAVTWAISVAVWKVRRVEERWGHALSFAASGPKPADWPRPTGNCEPAGACTW